jgi:hypothetical protein
MKRITKLGISATILSIALSSFPRPARASWGDFFLGVGAAVGIGAIAESNRQAEAERYRPVPPKQEYYRGLEDGMNGARYDNPRRSPDYDRGYEVGARRRRGR